MKYWQFQPGKAHPRFIDEAEVLQELKSKKFGTWIVIGSELQKKKGSKYVLCRCEKTAIESLVSIDNLRSGKSKGPRAATRLSEAEKILSDRYDAIVQRTRNPNCPAYRDYGGRGIENRFSRQEFVDYIKSGWPDVDLRATQIDRINNDGHYEPGNIRLVSARQNLTNTRRNVHIYYRNQMIVAGHAYDLIKTDFPSFSFSREWTTKLIKSGQEIQEIIGNGLQHLPPQRGRIPDVPNEEIVLLYRPKALREVCVDKDKQAATTEPTMRRRPPRIVVS